MTPSRLASATVTRRSLPEYRVVMGVGEPAVQVATELLRVGIESQVRDLPAEPVAVFLERRTGVAHRAAALDGRRARGWAVKYTSRRCCSVTSV